ncbi:zinc-binding dehydrogenase [Nocardioides lijunqiniae]|uniref:zinc-binding dehydrogenase n=1 Tax=Nocardioides lijunqiniae TaxID=2760832 RepID=UPI0030B7FC95
MLGEVDEPEAGVGEVIVDVAVAGMTFVETQVRRGVDPWHPPPPLPYIPGVLVAGRVTRLGAHVDASWLGRRVVASTGESGGFAERVRARVEDLFVVPNSLGFANATALCSDGSTAQGLFEGAKVRAGDWVLVEAAAGGVGSLLVQFARAAGARVIGAARGDAKMRALRSLGVDVAVDYANDGWTAEVLEVTRGVGADVVFDGVGGSVGAAAFTATAPGGTFSIHGASSGAVTAIDLTAAANRRIEVLGIEQLFEFSAHSQRWAEQAMSAGVTGTVRPLIGQTFDLAHAADAHAAVENRSTLGKTLIVVESEPSLRERKHPAA